MVNGKLANEHGRSDSEAQKSGDDIPFEFPQSEEEKWKAEERHHRRIERRYWRIGALLTGLTTVAAIVAAVFAGWALKASWESLAESMKATGEAHRQADEAKRQADIAQDAGRAWVGPIHFALADLKDSKEPLKIRITYQNFGHEPATHLRNRWNLAYLVKPGLPAKDWAKLPNWKSDKRFSPKEMCKRIVPSDNTSVAYPSPNFGFTIIASRNDDAEYPASVIPALFEAVKNQTAILITFGCFSYETVGKVRYSTFCAFLNPADGGKDISQWQFSACPVGNDDF